MNSNNQSKQEAIKQLPVLLTLGENIEVNLYDILSIDGFGNYSKINLINGKHIVSSKCLSVIDRLHLTGLIRVNRSSIIPIFLIKKVVYFNRYLVVVTTNTFVDYQISRRRIDRVLNALNAKRGDARSAKSRSLYLSIS